MAPPAVPGVSLIVLNWNGKRHLGPCLASLLELDYPADRLQVILCDNGSSDGSAAYVREHFPRVRVVALDRNHGFAEGNNLAAGSASGDWLGFLNNDMRVEPSWLSDMVRSAGDHPRASCIASRIRSWDGSTIDFIGGGVNYEGHGFQVDHGQTDSPHDVERRVLFACGGAMLIRRDVYIEVGGFDSDYFAFFEDVDLGWRLNLLGHEVWYTPRATAYHRHHGTASGVAPFKLHVLYERNALFTLYKCLSQEMLDRVLPTALLLVNERGLSYAAADRRRFELPSVAGGEPGSEPGPLPTRAFRVIRQEGLRPALVKAVKLLRHHVRRTIGTLALTAGRRLGHDLIVPSEDVVVWPSIGASRYVAISEFAHALDRLKLKRQWLQERRSVCDAELVPLFADPFFPNHVEPRYLEFYRWLTHVQGLDELFAPPRD